MNLYAFKIEADRYGYTLKRLREVQRRTGEKVQEFGDPTFHCTLDQVRNRIAEFAMRESVAAAADLQEALTLFNAAVASIEVTR